MKDESSRHGWRVTLAGTAINLALGILYTWSVFSKSIPVEWGWTEAQRALPYSIACIVFALVMVPAGRLQDRIGPRYVALAGGIAVGLGMILASRFTSVGGFILGFGVLAGAGIGMGYASATPPAVKWFPPQRTGLIAGIVVSGFGLASVYISPLAKYLIGRFGVQASMLIFGVAFMIVVSVVSQLLVNPPEGYKPQTPARSKAGAAKAPQRLADYSWIDMLKTPQFYLLWVMYVFGAGAGLMIISKLAKIVEIQAGIKAGFWFVALLAVGNASGRIIAGVLSDRIGRTVTMMSVFLLQAALMFLLRFVSDLPLFVVVSILLGFNYGANLSLFPSATKDYFGMRNFGVNYGLVFTAWGVGGLVLPIISGKVYDSTMAASQMASMVATIGPSAKVAGNFYAAYTIAGVCLVVAAFLTLLVKPPKERKTAAEGSGS